MTIKTHSLGNVSVSEVISPDIILKTEQDAVDLMGETQTEYIVVQGCNVPPEFFDLSTCIAGNILQKFTNYRVKLAILGEFDHYPSQTLRDFIYETNRKRDHLFVKSMDDVKALWRLV